MKWDNAGRFIFEFISIDQIGATKHVNVVSSIYGRNNVDDYLWRCVDKNMILAINKEKVNEVNLSIGGHFSEAISLINFDDTIANTIKCVKRE